MKQIVSDLKEFHTALGNPILDKPQIPGKDRIRLRKKLIKEEVTETLLAIKNNDLVEIADGIVDSIYVLVGCALEYGIDLTPVWEEVQRTNMTKKDGPVREDGKRLKPEGWLPPDIKSILLDQGATL